MSELQERIDVACPLPQAAARLKHFFYEHGNAEDDTLKLDLRLDVNVPGLSTPLTLERSVIATIQLHHLPADMTPRFTVHWAPEKPGPFPLFTGELLVEAREDYDSFTLRLSGTYTPPLGVVGKGFDVVLGNRIAQATAIDLLHRLKDMIEQQFEIDEGRKRRPESAGDSLERHADASDAPSG